MKKLGELLQGLDYTGAADLEAGVGIVVMDSRKVEPGALFVCVAGRNFDGHTAAADALQRGAVAVVAERKLGLENELVVADTRLAFARLCQNYFGNPQNALCLVGITGTNGKTTVSSVVKETLCRLGHKSGLIGTIRCEIGDTLIPAKFTTPEAWDICALFARMVAAGCTHVVMEASSQALAQGRLGGLFFDCAVFTNLTQDHLDYHGTMEEYYQAKKLLFEQSKHAVINIDDAHGKRLAEEISIPCITVSGKDDSANYTAKNIDYSISGVKFAINGNSFLQRVSFPMPGHYSVENALCALGALFALGIDRDTACEALSESHGVRGRCEVLYSGDFTIICDFAHTGDGLEQLLSSLRPFVEGRMVVLFGCAGDRDPRKRPAMAEAVCRYGDLIVLSSDNPRTEDPLSIINEITPILQASGKEFTAIPDRFFAIRWAVKALQKNDVLVLCGKGHEDYQVIDGCTIYLDEHQIVEEMIQEMGLA